MKIAIGNDHAGPEYKNAIVKMQLQIVLQKFNKKLKILNKSN